MRRCQSCCRVFCGNKCLFDCEDCYRFYCNACYQSHLSFSNCTAIVCVKNKKTPRQSYTKKSTFDLENFNFLVDKIGGPLFRGFNNTESDLCFLNSIFQVLKTLKIFGNEFIDNPQAALSASPYGTSTVSIAFNYIYFFDYKF
jgi:hypothetical protein